MEPGTTKTLLKQAAVAVGAEENTHGGYTLNGAPWYPLDDDADAFDLAVRLDMTVSVNKTYQQTTVSRETYNVVTDHYNSTPEAIKRATKLAIVHAAAAIGRSALPPEQTTVDRYRQITQQHPYARQVLEMMREMYGMPIYSFALNDRIIEDLGGEDIDIVELVMMIEDDFNITVSAETESQLKTVGDFIQLVEERLK